MAHLVKCKMGSRKEVMRIKQGDEWTVLGTELAPTDVITVTTSTVTTSTVTPRASGRTPRPMGF